MERRAVDLDAPGRLHCYLDVQFRVTYIFVPGAGGSNAGQGK